MLGSSGRKNSHSPFTKKFPFCLLVCERDEVNQGLIALYSDAWLSGLNLAGKTSLVAI
jgi:hypothetical protein